MKLKKTFLLFAVWFLAVSSFAKEDEYEYPELNVTPRASDRIHLEAKKEASSGYDASMLPIQVSGLTTAIAGFIQSGTAVPTDKASVSAAGTVGMMVGGAWFALGTYMALAYRPYISSDATVGSLPRGTPRDQLTRERLSEEELNSAARTGRALRWVSVLTNLGTNIFILGNQSSMNGPGSNTGLASGLAFTGMVLSLTPVFLHTHWENVADEQRDYKKRIFGPVASTTLLSEPVTHNLVPGAVISFFF